MPKIKSLYSFDYKSKLGTAWIGTTTCHGPYITICCPVCNTQGLKPLPQYHTPRIELLVTKPGTIDDIESLGMGVYLISKRVQDALRKAGLTGFKFVPLKGIAFDREGKPFEDTAKRIRAAGMRILHVTGVGGSIARTNHVRMTEQCKECGWIAWTMPRGRIKVVRRQWDGSDFFQVTEYTPILMTQRAADTLSAAGLTNFTPEWMGQFV